MLIPSVFKNIIKIGPAFLSLTNQRSIASTNNIIFLSMNNKEQASSVSSISRSKQQKQRLYIEKISNNATIPTRGTSLSAGYDLSSAEKTIIKAGCHGLVKTDLRIVCPEGTYGRIG